MEAMSREDFRGLVDAHAAELARYAASVLGGDDDAARDIVQEAFVKLWRDPPPVRGNLRAWLFSVCRTRSLDHLRRRGREVAHDESREFVVVDESPGPATRLETEDRHAAVLALVAGLSPRQREIVRLKFQNDLSYAEIAEITGLTATNVGFILHTALQSLRSRAGACPVLRQ